MRGNILVPEQGSDVEFQFAIEMVFLDIVADMIASIDEVLHLKEETQTKSDQESCYFVRAKQETILLGNVHIALASLDKIEHRATPQPID
jgi:hypothetical protein